MRTRSAIKEVDFPRVLLFAAKFLMQGVVQHPRQSSCEVDGRKRHGQAVRVGVCVVRHQEKGERDANRTRRSSLYLGINDAECAQGTVGN